VGYPSAGPSVPPSSTSRNAAGRPRGAGVHTAPGGDWATPPWSRRRRSSAGPRVVRSPARGHGEAGGSRDRGRRPPLVRRRGLARPRPRARASGRPQIWREHGALLRLRSPHTRARSQPALILADDHGPRPPARPPRPLPVWQHVPDAALPLRRRPSVRDSDAGDKRSSSSSRRRARTAVRQLRESDPRVPRGCSANQLARVMVTNQGPVSPLHPLGGGGVSALGEDLLGEARLPVPATGAHPATAASPPRPSPCLRLRLRRILPGPGFGAGPRGSWDGPGDQFEAEGPVGIARGVGTSGVDMSDEGGRDLGEAGQRRRLDLNEVRCWQAQIAAGLREHQPDRLLQLAKVTRVRTARQTSLHPLGGNVPAASTARKKG